MFIPGALTRAVSENVRSQTPEEMTEVNVVMNQLPISQDKL